MEFIVIEGDLFKTKKKFVLAHCVGRDMALGAGIALQFRQKYPEMIKFLYANKPEKAPDVVKWIGERTVYNLVTKELSSGKPTRDDFESSLIKLKELMIESGETNLAIPLIGAGLDKLEWEKSEPFIKDLFSDTDFLIVVCLFTPK